MSNSKKQFPTTADVKRDWKEYRTKDSFIKRPMDMASSMFSDRLTAVKFTAISLQYILQEQIRLKNEAVALGEELMDERNQIMDLWTTLFESRFWQWRVRIIARAKLNELVATIRKSEEEYYGDAGNKGEGAGENASGPVVESTSVEGVAERLPEEDIDDSEEGETEQKDLPSGGDGIPSTERDPFPGS